MDRESKKRTVADAEIKYPIDATKEELKAMTPTTRLSTILKIEVLEKLSPTEEGVELNEGYQYEVNGSIPQLADGLAKMAFEMDKDEDLGDQGGGAFLSLVAQYYEKLKSE